MNKSKICFLKTLMFFFIITAPCNSVSLTLFKPELQLVWNLNHASMRLKMNIAKWPAELRTLQNSLKFNAMDPQEGYVLYSFVQQIWFATEAMQYIFKYLLCHTLLITVNGRAHMEQQRHLWYPLQYIVRTVEKTRLRPGNACQNASERSLLFNTGKFVKKQVSFFKSLLKSSFLLFYSPRQNFRRELLEKHFVLKCHC